MTTSRKRLFREAAANAKRLQMHVACQLGDEDLACIDPAKVTIGDLVRAANAKGCTLHFPPLRRKPWASVPYSPHAYREATR